MLGRHAAVLDEATHRTRPAGAPHRGANQAPWQRTHGIYFAAARSPRSHSPLAGAPALRASADSWPVFGFDASRSGFNSLERTLTVGNVNHLHERWQIALGSVADSTPILLQHVRVGRSYRNVLFQTTKSGETLAIEARSGRILWRFDTHGVNYTHSTPAADPSGKAIYVPGIDGKVHKLSAAKGRELSAPGFPAVVTRAPSTEAVESPLNVANGYLYATTSGYNGDGTPYDGHVVAINLQNGKRTVFNSLCSNRHKLIDPGSCTEQRSGIWARGGAVVDPDPSMNDRVYASTGNGDFNANTGGSDYGDSIVSLSDDLRDLLGSYTPTDYKGLDQGDVDLGSTSPVMLAGAAVEPDAPNAGPGRQRRDAQAGQPRGDARRRRRAADHRPAQRPLLDARVVDGSVGQRVDLPRLQRRG